MSVPRIETVFHLHPGTVKGRNRMYGYPLGRSDQLPLQFKSIKVKATLFTIYIYIYICIYMYVQKPLSAWKHTMCDY